MTEYTSKFHHLATNQIMPHPKYFLMVLIRFRVSQNKSLCPSRSIQTVVSPSIKIIVRFVNGASHFHTVTLKRNFQCECPIPQGVYEKPFFPC